MSETSVKGPYPYAKIVLVATAFLVLVLALPAVFLSFLRPPKGLPEGADCASHLRMLKVSMDLYANEHEGRYPDPERWCDLLAESYVDAETFRCPAMETGPCNYAMNPRANRQGARDVVLLFESEPGWNQSGGPELLTTENHAFRGAECNVLFVNGSVRRVGAEELTGLKW